MATTINNIKVDFALGAQSPLVTFLQGADMSIPNVQETLRQIEESDEGRSQFRYRIIKASGNEPFSSDGTITNALTVTILEPYEIFFEAGALPFQSDTGNILGTFVESPGAIVQINNAVGSLNQNTPAIEYSSFDGGVWLDETSSNSGTGYHNNGQPMGNGQNPVNNVPDAVAICNARGLPKTIYVIGSYTFDAGDDISGFLIVGQNATRTTITINDAAETLGCEIIEASILGNLDGNTIIRNSVISNLNYINGVVHNTLIAPGVISLGGASTAYFLDCTSGKPGQETPVLDMNGLSDNQATPLVMHGYKGGIKLVGMDSNVDVTIDMGGGQVIVDLTTCTLGTLVVRGVGKVVDQDGNHMSTATYNGGLEVVNEAVFGGHLHDLWKILGLDPDEPLVINENGTITVGNITIAAVTTGVTPNRITTQTRT